MIFLLILIFLFLIYSVLWISCQFCRSLTMLSFSIQLYKICFPVIFPWQSFAFCFYTSSFNLFEIRKINNIYNLYSVQWKSLKISFKVQIVFHRKYIVKYSNRTWNKIENRRKFFTPSPPIFIQKELFFSFKFTNKKFGEKNRSLSNLFFFLYEKFCVPSQIAIIIPLFGLLLLRSHLEFGRGGSDQTGAWQKASNFLFRGTNKSENLFLF